MCELLLNFLARSNHILALEQLLQIKYMVQKMYRGMMGRADAKFKLESVSATKIQCLVRGWLGRARATLVRLGKVSVSWRHSPLKFLGVEKTASSSHIKKAYHRLALRLHPDKLKFLIYYKYQLLLSNIVFLFVSVHERRNKDDPSACENFGKLQSTYEILINDERRK